MMAHDCLVPAEETYCGEYVYCMPLQLTGDLTKKGGNFKYEVEEDFKKILSALLNTSGGFIHLVPQIPQIPLGNKYFDEWRNSLKDKLNFIPVNVYQNCIAVHVEPAEAFVLVNKANQFITVNAHLHSRHSVGACNIQIQEYCNISGVVSSFPESTSNTTPLRRRGPFIHGHNCPMLESQQLEFKHYKDQSGVDHLIKRLGAERELRAMFGMANLTSGGDIVLGIAEDPSTKANVYKGQRLSVSQEKGFKIKLQELLERDTNRQHIWGSTNTLPEEGEHWSCEFIPLQMPSQPATPQERLVLIVIHLFHCPGGAFLDTPESYNLSDDGSLVKVNFEAWHTIHRRTSITIVLEREPPKKGSKKESSAVPNPSTVASGSSNNPGQAANITEITPDSVFEDNTSICYTKHSSSWDDSNNKRELRNTVQHPEIIDLFKIGHPIRYNPCRETLQHILTTFNLQDFLSVLESTVAESGFGIAADVLWNCLKHSCTIVTTPQRHVLDVFIVTGSARMILAAAVPECNTASSIRSLNAHKVRLARIIKRRMLESISLKKGTQTYSKFMIDCQLSKSDGSPETCPDFIVKWFTGSNFQEVCSALASVLKGMDTCFRALIARYNDSCLSLEQIDTLKRLDPNRFSIIEGSPGSGKTLLARLFTASKGPDAAAYISASKALTNRALAEQTIRAFYAKDSTEILFLLGSSLKEVRHIVIDDNHNYSYTHDQMYELCKMISKQNQSLHVFQDSRFQNHDSQNSNELRIFVAEHHEYGSVFIKTMNTIFRNSQIVGSFLSAQMSELQTANIEVACASTVKGDEILTKQITNIWEAGNNGLLKHVQDILKPFIAPHHHHYTYRDIAILVDDKSETTEEDVMLFRSILGKHWPIQNADVFPVRGLIVDTLQNFKGLESRVVLLVLPRSNRHQFLSASRQTKVHSVKHRIAVASRGIDRVEFLQDSNLDRQTVEGMKCDLWPRNALKLGGHSRPHSKTRQSPFLRFRGVKELWHLEKGEDITDLCFIAVDGTLAILYISFHDSRICVVSTDGEPLSVSVDSPGVMDHVCTASSRDGRRVVITGWDDSVPGSHRCGVYEVRPGRVARVTTWDTDSLVLSVSWTRDDDVIILLGRDDHPGDVARVSPTDGRVLWRLDSSVTHLEEGVRLSVNPRTDAILVSDTDCVRELSDQGQHITDISLSSGVDPDALCVDSSGRLMFLRDCDAADEESPRRRDIHLHNTSLGQTDKVIKAPGQVYNTRLHEDRYLGVATADGIVMYDVSALF